METLLPFLRKHQTYREGNILERMTEPDRIIIFRVCWQDDDNNIRTNRAYRVQFNNAIGPYKGGLRFHKNVTLSVLKFLGFEQTLKNSLTGLPMGGGQGRVGLQPQGQERQRGDAVLPLDDDGTLATHRRGRGHPGW